MMKRSRRHHRFTATAFLNTPVRLSPLPPYFTHSLQGKLIDLSSSGVALILNALIPEKVMINLSLIFPDGSRVETLSRVIHSVPRDRQFLHGFEFIHPPVDFVQKIEKMSSDYIDCENRIQSGEENVCTKDCAFYSICEKTEKNPPMKVPFPKLELVLTAS